MSIPVISSRTQGQVVVSLDRKGSVPTLPYELHQLVSADAWAARIPQLIRLSNRYNHPVAEGAWFIFIFIATLAIPAALHNVILHSLSQAMSPSDAIYQARFISFAIAVGILLLCFAPHVVWKYMGQKRATELVKQWEAEDARPRAPGAFIPVWTVRLPGYLSSNTRLTITTPNTAAPSYFHPAAYTPSWINGPANTGAVDGIPPAYQGAPQQAMFGDVPIYGNPYGVSGASLPPYVGDGAYSNEKV